MGAVDSIADDDASDVPSHAPKEMLETSRRLRQSFRSTAHERDLEGRVPEDNLAAIRQAGLGDILLPAAYGGRASSAALTADLPLQLDAATELSAGESSTAQVWVVHALASPDVIPLGANLAQGILMDTPIGGKALGQVLQEYKAKYSGPTNPYILLGYTLGQIIVAGLERTKPVGGKFSAVALYNPLLHLGTVNVAIGPVTVENATVQFPLVLDKLGPSGWTTIGNCTTSTCTASS